MPRKSPLRGSQTLPPLPPERGGAGGWIFSDSDPAHDYWLAIEKDDDLTIFEDDLAAAESLSPVVMMYCPQLGIFAPAGIPEDLLDFHWQTVIPNPRKLKTVRQAIDNAQLETLSALGFRT
jgi:hypothetical protein